MYLTAIFLGTILGLMVGIPIGVATIDQMKAQATGGAGEIKGLIDPIIDRAISAVQSNNSELALEELYTLQQELDDTFAVDEEEENEENEKEDGDDKKKNKD
jgi:hypothetical protein